MKKVFIGLCVALLLAVCSVPALAATPADFSDMPAADHWSYGALCSALDNGLLSGRADGTLDPQGNLTRAEMAAVINRAFGAVETASLNGFSDVSAADWYCSDMAKAVKMGTFQGGNGLLRPRDNITREEAFVVLARAIGLQDGAFDLYRFSDSAAVSSWAVGPLRALSAKGYVSGSQGKLNPQDYITRAEFAQVMANLISQYITVPGSYSSLSGSGNVLIRCAGVTLNGVNVNGDLIIGDGVYTGDFDLNSVTVTGRVVPRGSGSDRSGGLSFNSCAIRGGVYVINIPTGDMRIRLNGCKDLAVENACVNETDKLIIEGEFDELDLSGYGSATLLQDSIVKKITISGDHESLTVDKDSRADEINVNGDNDKVNVAGRVKAINVAKGARNADIDTSGSGVIEKINGEATDEDELSRSDIDDLTFIIEYSTGKVRYNAVYDDGCYTSVIDLTQQASAAKLESGKISADLNGDSDAHMDFDPGYGDGFRLNQAYSLLSFLTDAEVQDVADVEELTVGGLILMLKDLDGYDNMANWKALTGHDWPSSVDYNAADGSATVHGEISASNFDGTVDYDLVLKF